MVVHSCIFLYMSAFYWLYVSIKLISYYGILLSILIFNSTACIKLEEYQTAKAALEAGSSLAPGDTRFTQLIKECEKRIAGILLTTCFLIPTYVFCETNF